MRSTWSRLTAQAYGYAIGVVVSKYVVGFSATFIAKLCYDVMAFFGASRGTDGFFFYTNNWLAFNFIAGAVFGVFMYAPWIAISTAFVWVPFAAILAYKILTYPHSVLDTSSAAGLRHYLAMGCTNVSLSQVYISVQCTDQVLYSLPFYAAVGFSVGIVLRRMYSQRIRCRSISV